MVPGSILLNSIKTTKNLVNGERETKRSPKIPFHKNIDVFSIISAVCTTKSISRVFQAKSDSFLKRRRKYNILFNDKNVLKESTTNFKWILSGRGQFTQSSIPSASPTTVLELVTCIPYCVSAKMFEHQSWTWLPVQA